jgi:hypothetical protein
MQHANDIGRLGLLSLASPDHPLRLHLAAAAAADCQAPLLHQASALPPTTSLFISSSVLLQPVQEVAVQPVQPPQRPRPDPTSSSSAGGITRPGLQPNHSDNASRFTGEKPLPSYFQPGPNAVMIGRKKHCYTSMGNLRLRDIVLLSLLSYSKCSKKKEKTDIVSGIVDMVRDACPGGMGAFVKCNNEGRWFEVSDIIARERVASIFRDFLCDQYKSSSKQKVRSRREKRAKRKSKPKKAESSSKAVTKKKQQAK